MFGAPIYNKDQCSWTLQGNISCLKDEKSKEEFIASPISAILQQTFADINPTTLGMRKVSQISQKMMHESMK